MADNNNNLGSALLNTAGGLITSALNRNYQGRLLKRQQAWSEKMAAQQNQWNIEQWQRENEYNAPVNQMARFEAAGINPYNAVASGQIGSGSASSLQSATPNNVAAPSFAEAFRNPMSDFYSGLSSSLDNALKVISVDKGKEDVRGAKGLADKNVAEGIKAQNDLVNEPSRVAANYNLYQSQMHEFAFNSQKYALLGQGVPEIVANELAQMRSNTQILQLQAEGMGYDNKQKYAIAKFAEATERAKLEQLVQQGQLTKAQAENMRKQNSWFEKLTMAQLANYAANTAAAYGSADASHAAAGLSRQQTATERERTSYERKQNDWFTPTYDQRMYRSGKYGENSESYPFLRSMYRAGEFLKSFVPSLFGTPKQ